MMFVYLDESGDTGFKFNRGSSRYFVITLLLIEDPIALQVAVDTLRETLEFSPSYEFKFHRSDYKIRVEFLRMLQREKFWVRVLVIDKWLITRPDMRKHDTFYSYLVEMILKHDDSTISDAVVVLDESVRDKKSKQQLSTSLRKALNTIPEAPKIRDIFYHNSKSDNLIQITDMVCGAIAAKYHRDDETYFQIIRAEINDLWEWTPYRAQ